MENKMTKDEKSLLLFFEACAVDFGGKVDTRRMNDTDQKIVKKWTEDKFISFGRICHTDIMSSSSFDNKTYWVQLSEKAWELARAERYARAKRMWGKRTWKKTSEK